MGSDHHVVTALQRVISREWLGNSYVQARARQMPRVEGFHQGILIYNTPASSVDEQRPLAHLRERLATEEFTGFVGQWTVGADHVAALQQLVERDQIDVLVVRVEVRIMGDDLHVEATRGFDDPFADGAVADHAEGSLSEFDAFVVDVVVADVAA